VALATPTGLIFVKETSESAGQTIFGRRFDSLIVDHYQSAVGRPGAVSGECSTHELDLRRRTDDGHHESRNIR
jgi:hypothetical protein